MFGDQPINYTLNAISAIPRYHIVVASGAGAASMAIAPATNLAGVAQNDPGAGEFVTVCPLGRSRVYAGGTLAVGDRITSTTSGRATAAGSGSAVIGVALEAAASGDLTTILVNVSGARHTA